MNIPAFPHPYSSVISLVYFIGEPFWNKGVVTKAVFKNGAFCDEVRYAIIKD
jgi:RimJ/RimL family protein N-acetyltransferase